jgi:aminoglycoside phosphotransferase (APT) family kinase protein
MAALATYAVPDIDIVAVRGDREGADYSFAMAEDSDGRFWVVRAPHSAAAGAGQEAEVILLRSLAAASASGTLPFEVPRPRGFAPLADGGRAMVYPALPGDPVVMELLEPGPGLATSIGRALAALHEIAPGVVEAAGLPAYTASQYRRRLRSEVDDAGRTGYVTSRLIDRWLGRLELSESWLFQPVVIHGDMAPDHMLEEHGRVSAILDFSTVQVSDPAEDLAPMLAAASPKAAESILDSYSTHRHGLNDPHLAARAEFLAELAVARWLLFGMRHEDPAIVRDARAMLADLDKAVAEQEHHAELARREAERKAHDAAERRAAAERASLRADRETAERRAIQDVSLTAIIELDSEPGTESGPVRAPEPGPESNQDSGKDFAPEIPSEGSGSGDLWPRSRPRVPTWEEADTAERSRLRAGPKASAKAGAASATEEADAASGPKPRGESDPILDSKPAEEPESDSVADPADQLPPTDLDQAEGTLEPLKPDSAAPGRPRRP